MNGIRSLRLALAVSATLGGVWACGSDAPSGTVVTLPASALGVEAEVLRRQIERFEREHPEIRVVAQRTPDAADQRRQLYVQWLNARARDPDVLQLDVIWTPEFAAAGWLLDLDRFDPPCDDYFPATLKANRWRGRLYALPWFVDVGMLYWRTDLLDAPPTSLDQLVASARAAQSEHGVPYGLVWQGARYEGLVTVFVEYLAAHGGRILDPHGEVVVDSVQAVEALRAMRDAIHGSGVVPRSALTWHEEETRFAFQNGRAAYMRNWPYAFPLMQRSAESRVAGRFAVTALPAATPSGRAAATLGGSQLAINANSDVPDAAWTVIAYLTAPEQMRERAQLAGQYPPRPSLYADPALVEALPIPPDQVRDIIERAVPRPSTPVYTELSSLLQIRLHRALSGQQEPPEALAGAAADIRRLLKRVQLLPRDPDRDGEGAAAVVH